MLPRLVTQDEPWTMDVRSSLGLTVCSMGTIGMVGRRQPVFLHDNYSGLAGPLLLTGCNVPWKPGDDPIHYQLIEGRFAGMRVWAAGS